LWGISVGLWINLETNAVEFPLDKVIFARHIKTVSDTRAADAKTMSGGALFRFMVVPPTSGVASVLI
jgi:hypothetical protein